MLCKKPQEWLVVEYNGFRCTGIRASVARGSIQIHRTAMSTEPKVEQSLSSVLSDLQTEDVSPIRQAILITSQAAAAVVPLPINPAVASNRDQLQSLVQWEFEQVLSEHTAALSLETILAGRGCLSEDEIDDVRVAIGEQKASTSCISIAPKRFGEQAVQMGYVSAEDVESSLLLLEQFMQPDDSPICNFFPIETSEPVFGNEGFPWLVCGIGEQNQAQWISRFAAHDIRLERVYPLGFTAGSALPDLEGEKRIGLISLLEGADCYTSIVDQQLKSLRWGPAPLSPRNPEALCALIGEDSLDELWLTGREGIVCEVTRVLDQTTKFPTKAFPNHFPTEIDSNQSSSEQMVEMVGAMRHQIGASQIQTPWIEGAPPPPPWWQQSSKWWGIMGIVIGCMVFTSELVLGLQRHSVTMATKEIKDQMKTAQGEIAKVQFEASTADQLIEKRTDLKSSIEITSQAADLIDRGLNIRQSYTTQLFTELANAVTPAIAINEFHETRNHSVQISAWALTETDAQEFIHNLTSKMEPWGLTLSHQEVQNQAGRLGLMGYDLSLRLDPVYTRLRH